MDGFTDSQGFMILIFFSVNRAFETVLLLKEQYVTRTQTPNDY